jgi:uncharacterized membrane protein
MATVIPTTGEQMSVSRVFSRAMGVITGNPATVFGIAFLFGALPSVLFSWLQQSIRPQIMDKYAQFGFVAITLASAVIGLILSALVQGALVRATISYSNGERASFADSARTGLSMVFPLIGLAILLALAVGIGFMFLLVPGIILYVMWSVATPALVAERTGVFAAFGRSRALTKGARWKVFGVELIIVLVWWAISAVVGVLLFRSIGLNGMQATARTGLPISWLIGNVLLATLINAFWSTIQTSLYVELKIWKEGHSDAALQDIFA